METKYQIAIFATLKNFNQIEWLQTSVLQFYLTGGAPPPYNCW